MQQEDWPGGVEDERYIAGSYQHQGAAVVVRALTDTVLNAQLSIRERASWCEQKPMVVIRCKGNRAIGQASKPRCSGEADVMREPRVSATTTARADCLMASFFFWPITQAGNEWPREGIGGLNGECCATLALLELGIK